MSRRALVVAGVLVLLALGTIAAFRASVALLRDQVTEALGSGAEIGSLDVGLRAVAVNELRLPGGAGWPVPDALQVGRVAIAPSLRSIFSRQMRIASITVTEPYVSMLRTRAGRLRLVPTLLERGRDAGTAPSSTQTATASGPAPGHSVTLRRLTVSQGEVDLYDATAGRKPWRIRLVGLDATLRSIVAPALDRRVPLEVRGVIDGPSADGKLVLSGWLDPGTRDLDLTVRLRGVDLLAFEPYVMSASKARLSRGRFDLDLHATVTGQRLHAPGHLELIDLAFVPGGRGSDRVLGVPRDLLLAAMASRAGRLAVDFQLDGNVADPRFSLNENLNARIAASLIDSLGGLSIPGLVEGVTGTGGGALGGSEQVGKSVGSVLKGLLRGR